MTRNIELIQIRRVTATILSCPSRLGISRIIQERRDSLVQLIESIRATLHAFPRTVPTSAWKMRSILLRVKVLEVSGNVLVELDGLEAAIGVVLLRSTELLFPELDGLCRVVMAGELSALEDELACSHDAGLSPWSSSQLRRLFAFRRRPGGTGEPHTCRDSSLRASAARVARCLGVTSRPASLASFGFSFRYGSQHCPGCRLHSCCTDAGQPR